MGEIGGSAPMMLGVMWTFQAIAFGLVALRVYARLNVVQTYGWDDHFFNGAVALVLVYNILCTAASSYGLGQPLSSPPTADQSHAQLLVNIAQSVINTDAVLVKMSMATFLLRLVPASRGQKVILLLPATLMSVMVVGALIALWFACTPVQYSWTLGAADGHCNGEEEFILALVAGISIILAEIFYASYPWYLIWGLQIPRKEKIMIGACMSFGYLSAVCSIYRLLQLLNLAYASNDNFLVTTVHLMIWHEADIITQLVCIGVSVCRPLYKDWLNDVVVKLASSTGGSRNKSASDGSASGFSVIALQTIGGSSVLAKGGRKDSCHSGCQDPSPTGGGVGVVKVERSWRVDSKSRGAAAFPGDAASDEHILEQEQEAGVADVDHEHPHGNRRQG